MIDEGPLPFEEPMVEELRHRPIDGKGGSFPFEDALLESLKGISLESDRRGSGQAAGSGRRKSKAAGPKRKSAGRKSASS